MGIRESLNKNPKVTTGIAVVVVVLAVGYLVWQLAGSSAPSAERQLFFTDDDGKTFFSDDATKFPPFDHNGKQAYRAYVFTCDDGKTAFVGYMERYTADAQAKLNAAKQAGTLLDVPEELYTKGSELKKPGDTEWTPRTARDAYKITSPACPGGTGTIKMIG